MTKYFVLHNHQPFFISDVSDALTRHKTRTRMCQKSRLWITLTVKSVNLIFCPDQLIPLLIPYAFNWQTSSSMRILWPHSWSIHRKPLCNQPPPQICLFDIIFVTDACSLLFQPSPDVEHLHCGTQQNSSFMIQLDSCISALSYYLVKSVYVHLDRNLQILIFFCQHRKTIAWPKPRTSLIPTMQSWDQFLCKIVSKLQRNWLYFLNSWTWAISQCTENMSEKKDALYLIKVLAEILNVAFMWNMWIVVDVDDGS